MERASQVITINLISRLSSQNHLHHNQAFTTFALISILIRSHQQPPLANHPSFGRIRMRHHRRHLKQNPYLAQGVLFFMRRMQIHNVLHLLEHAQVQEWLR